MAISPRIRPGLDGLTIEVVLFVRFKKREEAIVAYKRAAINCGISKDSLCLVECFEHIRSQFSGLEEFEQAEEYFLKAIPLIDRCGEDNQRATMTNSLGIIYSREGNSEEAIVYISKAVQIYRGSGSLMKELKAMNNLAEAYRNLGA